VRSSRKFRVRGPFHESELRGKGTFTLHESALAERPPHPDPLPASGEGEQTPHAPLAPMGLVPAIPIVGVLCPPNLDRRDKSGDDESASHDFCPCHPLTLKSYGRMANAGERNAHMIAPSKVATVGDCGA
jgi:hypothetical protein